MNLLIIGTKKSEESQLLKKEAEKRDHSVEIASLTSLIFSNGKKQSILTKDGKDINEFDAVLFRAINQHIIEAKIVAKYMKERQKTVVDEILAQGDYEYNKLFMHSKLWTKHIPQPLTLQAFNLKNIERVFKKIKAPLMVKHAKEMHGRSVFRFDSKKEALNFFKENKEKRLGCYLIQEWYPSKHYYRTLVLENRVLGAMKRLSLKCKNRPKIPLNQRSKKAELTPGLKKLSLKTVRALGIELAGLDIMPDKNGELKVLEINRSPQFKRFSQITGVNVAEEIIKYLEQKLKNRRNKKRGNAPLFSLTKLPILSLI